MVLVIAGEVEAANAICGWMRRNMITPEGTIEGPYRVVNDAYAYRNSAFIIGAHLAMQYDLSYGLMPDLLSWQDAVSGAFANDRLEDGGKSDEMDIPYACGPGFACLITGHFDAARAVYRHLKRIYEAQTELPDRFYYNWSRAQQAPITEFLEEKSLSCVSEGYWRWDEVETEGRLIHTVLEFVMHMNTLISGLASRP